MKIKTKDIVNHSRNIKIVKFALLSLVLLLLFSVAISPFITTKHENLHMVFGDQNAETTSEESDDVPITKITMPKFYGIDLKDRPFTIDADEGIQLDEKTATLKNVYGDIKLDEKTFVEIKSSTAIIHLESKDLDLKDNVEVKLNDDYLIKTDESTFSPANNSLSGQKGISVINKKTNITADTFIITDDYNNIVFKKNVKMIIQND